MKTVARRSSNQFWRMPCSLWLVLAFGGLSLAPTGARAAGVVTSPTEASLDAALSGGGLVTFSCDGTIVLNSTKTIALNTTIDASGRDITISANPAAKGSEVSLRVLIVNTGVTVNLKNLTIANGYAYSGTTWGAKARGGAIFNRGNLTLSNCTVRDNLADGLYAEGAAHEAYGGAIYNNAGNLVLDRCTFKDNQAQGGDGGISFVDGFTPVAWPGANGIGGAIFMENGTLTITNSTFDGNIASGGYGSDVYRGTGGGAGGEAWGGAIYGGGSISASTFVNNRSIGGDGGSADIDRWGREGSRGAGGAIYGGGVLVNCTFNGNSAKGGAGGDGGTGGNGGEGYGGAVYNLGMTSTNCTFAGNTALGGQGGTGGYYDPETGQAIGSGASGKGYGGNLHGGSPTVTNTIIANGSTDVGANCSAPLTDNGNNLSSDGSCGLGASSYQNVDPKLSPPANNGGPTHTMALAANSPAINHGNDSKAPPRDQRGLFRNGVSDIGAFEYGGLSGLTVSGRILNGSGTGIAGVTVTIDGATSIVTGADGSYRFSDIAPGSHAVTPTSPGLTFNPANRTVNATTTSANFTALFSITGLVRTSSMAPVAGVAVTLRSTSGALPPSVSPNPVLTDSTGAYRFSNIPNGLYNLVPAKAGYNFSPSTAGLSVTTSSRAANFTAIPHFRIIGRIATSNGASLAGVNVIRSGSSTPAATNSAGYFTFTGVPNGTYTITPNATGYGFNPASRNVTFNGADITAQNFTAFTGYRISGRIATSSGVAIPGISVVRTGSPTPVSTNSAGYYTFENVPNGSYTVTPGKTNTTFSPANKSVTVNGSNVANQNFVGSGP